ncbi:MAG: leucine-rich repeat protein [Clostridia bacterium]|nr:leucine-rich repeat protein [Clostridia bacterium]
MFCILYHAKIVIPSNVGVIPKHAFEHFEKLEELTISANVKTIQSYAFSGCDNLKRIVFDSSPTVDDCAFNLIPPSKLEEITFLKAPPKFTKYAFGLFRLSYIKPLTIKVKRDFLNDAKLAIARIISDNITDKSNDGQKKIETILNSKNFTFEII